MKHLGVVDQLVKGSLDFIAGQISRPRLADNWAGSGEYEYAFLTALNASGKFPNGHTRTYLQEQRRIRQPIQ
jgi:hypothetical protein